ncbi:MAG: zf-HC2 domain-containing protein [Elusimicrobiota bacterium]|jgi:anti-sigma factor RsiW
MNAGCIEREALSAYADAESGPEERAGIESHLAACARCRARLEMITALKKAVAAAVVPAPAMPADLREKLLRMRMRSMGLWPRLLGFLREFSPRRRVMALSFSAAGLVLALWIFREDLPGIGSGEEELPVSVLLAAHGRYASTLPLSGAEGPASRVQDLLAEASDDL